MKPPKRPIKVNPLARKVSRAKLRGILKFFVDERKAYYELRTMAEQAYDACKRKVVDSAIRNGYEFAATEWRWENDRDGLVRDCLIYLDTLRKAK